MHVVFVPEDVSLIIYLTFFGVFCVYLLHIFACFRPRNQTEKLYRALISHIVCRMSSNEHPLQKRRRVSRCEYNACDRGPNGKSVNNRKFSGFVGLFQRMFHEEVGATEWAETTLHKMQQRFVQLGVRGSEGCCFIWRDPL